jgi:hypothetical protein
MDGMTRFSNASISVLLGTALFLAVPWAAHAEEAYARFRLELKGDVAKGPAVVPPSFAARQPIPIVSDGETAMMPRPLGAYPHFTDGEMQSLGCLVGGIAGTGAALAAGGVSVINIVAGGLVPVNSNLALGTALVGVVFASFCAVGQALTPAAIMLYNNSIAPPQPDPDELAGNSIHRGKEPRPTTRGSVTGNALPRSFALE